MIFTFLDHIHREFEPAHWLSQFHVLQPIVDYSEHYDIEARACVVKGIAFQVLSLDEHIVQIIDVDLRFLFRRTRCNLSKESGDFFDDRSLWVVIDFLQKLCIVTIFREI